MVTKLVGDGSFSGKCWFPFHLLSRRPNKHPYEVSHLKEFDHLMAFFMAGQPTPPNVPLIEGLLAIGFP